MTTKLDGTLRREILIDRQPYTLTISPDGFVLALKGRRKGLEISWEDLVNGDAAMATALNASLSANIQRKIPAGVSAANGNAGANRKASKQAGSRR